MGKFSFLARDAAGRVTSRTDANSKTTTYKYDALGRLVKQTDANNGETDFTYDSLGNIKTLTDPKRNITKFDYDLAGRKIKETRPMGENEEYTYYPNGLLKTVKDAKGQISTFTYDAANRLTQITYADNKKDGFTYDYVGNMLTYSKEGVNGSFTYDELNRKTSETVNYGPFAKTYSYTYDALGNKKTFKTPDGKVYTYEYNKNNQPTSIAFEGKTIDFTYLWNRRTQAKFPNGITTDYEFNDNSWLTSIKAGTVLSEENEYDFAGNITQKTTENDSIAYDYDSIYQLTQATGSVLPPETFAYDKIGNRQSATEGTNTTTYIHNANNELISANGVNYDYDANGNLIYKTENFQVTTYNYNTGNRMESVELPDGRTATYTYDPFGRRIKKQIGSDTTYYLYSDEGLIGEYDDTGEIKKEYGWLPDMVWGTAPVFMVENGQYYYYHNDTLGLGTPRKMTDSTGAVVWSANYTAFGKATVDPGSTVTNNLRFPGQYFDEETGLCYNWNRYYDPGTGRYTQADPIGLDGGISLFADDLVQSEALYSFLLMHPQLLNYYNYGYGNPLKYIDSEGALAWIIAGGVVGAIWGAYDAIQSGKDPWQAAFVGGLTGALSTAFPGGGMIAGAIIGCGTGMLGNFINQAREPCTDSINRESIGKSCIAGAIGGAIGAKFNKIIRIKSRRGPTLPAKYKVDYLTDKGKRTFSAMLSGFVGGGADVSLQK
ncbi:MAG: RHS repeat-associated core domain-containing protein [Pseudomonadota bacterium]